MQQIFPILINKHHNNYQHGVALCKELEDGNFPFVTYITNENNEVSHGSSKRQKQALEDEACKNLRLLNMEEWTILSTRGDAEPAGLMQHSSVLTASLILEKDAMRGVQGFFKSETLLVGIPSQKRILVATDFGTISELNSRFFNEAMLDDNDQALIPQLLLVKDGHIIGHFHILNGSLTTFDISSRQDTRKFQLEKTEAAQVSSDTITLKKQNYDDIQHGGPELTSDKVKKKRPKKRFKIRR